MAKEDTDTNARAETDVAGAQSSGGTTDINRSEQTSSTTRQERVNQDIGTDEGLARGVAADSHLYEANRKRTFDAYQDLEPHGSPIFFGVSKISQLFVLLTLTPLAKKCLGKQA